MNATKSGRRGGVGRADQTLVMVWGKEMDYEMNKEHVSLIKAWENQFSYLQHWQQDHQSLFYIKMTNNSFVKLFLHDPPFAACTCQ